MYMYMFILSLSCSSSLSPSLLLSLPPSLPPDSLQLVEPQYFHYLNQSGCVSDPTIDDASDFLKVSTPQNSTFMYVYMYGLQCTVLYMYMYTLVYDPGH